MNTTRPSQNPSADPNDPTQRFRNGFREVLAEYESAVRRRRSIRNRPSQIASTDLNNDPSDRFMARLQTLIAQHENEIRRQYLLRATRLKARNGYAVRRPPTGYVANRAGRWRMDPDAEVRESITRLFEDFKRLVSIGKVLGYYHENGILLPVRITDLVHWTRPSRGRIRAILTHPAYTGAYVFGRRVTVNGWTRRQANADEVIVVPNHHEPYITRDRSEHIQALLRRNRRSGK